MKAHAGLSLLEVILALAILGGALAVTGELVRIGLRAADRSRSDTYAQLLCESKLAEIATGIALPEPVVDEVIDPDGMWLHTVEIEASEDQTLLAVRVTVRPADSSDPTRALSLVRWLADPDSEAADRALQDEREAAEQERLDQSKQSGSGSNNAGGATNSGSEEGTGPTLPGNGAGPGAGGTDSAGTPGDPSGGGGGAGLLPDNVRGLRGGPRGGPRGVRNAASEAGVRPRPGPGRGEGPPPEFGRPGGADGAPPDSFRRGPPPDGNFPQPRRGGGSPNFQPRGGGIPNAGNFGNGAANVPGRGGAALPGGAGGNRGR